MSDNIIDNKTSLEEVAAYICRELKQQDIEVVLSGGGCMELYSKSEFSSFDLDFIMKYAVEEKELNNIIENLGFEKQKISKYFKHPNNPYYVEFINGPIGLGDEFVKEFSSRNNNFGKLILLTVEDCIKDRLCAYVYHYDNKCLDQAVSVAKNNDIDYTILEKWVEKESGNDMNIAYKEFLELLFTVI